MWLCGAPYLKTDRIAKKGYADRVIEQTQQVKGEPTAYMCLPPMHKCRLASVVLIGYGVPRDAGANLQAGLEMGDGSWQAGLPLLQHRHSHAYMLSSTETTANLKQSGVHAQVGHLPIHLAGMVDSDCC